MIDKKIESIKDESAEEIQARIDKVKIVGVDISEKGACDNGRTRYFMDGKLVVQYQRCLCGSTWIEGPRSPACITCRKCGSTLAVGPADHEEPQLHQYVEDGHCGFCGAEGKK